MKDFDQLYFLLVSILREIALLIGKLRLAIHDQIFDHDISIDVPIVLHLNDDVFDLLIMMYLSLLNALLSENDTHQPQSAEVINRSQLRPKGILLQASLLMIWTCMICQVPKYLFLEDGSRFKLCSPFIGCEMWVIKHDSLEKFIHRVYQLLLTD